VEQLHADGDVVISLAVVGDGVVVGHVMLSVMRAPFRALGLAPVSVVPARRVTGARVRLALCRGSFRGA